MMKNAIGLCLPRIVLSAVIGLLSACERDAVEGQGDTGEDTSNADEDTSDANEEASDPVEEGSDTSDSSQDTSETENALPAEDASAAEGASVSDDASSPEDLSASTDAAQSADVGVMADADRAQDQSFLPWREGNTWTYRVTNKGKVTTKVVTIAAEERVGGGGPHADELAFRVVTKKGALDQTISWQAVRDSAVVRFREQSFHADTGALELEEHWSPYKLHFDGSDAHTKAGASWYEAYDETKIAAGASPLTSSERDRWLVDAPEEKVTVPAGTFHAVVVMKAGGGEVKTYWYARGVGKVKETGGQTEELVSYELSD